MSIAASAAQPSSAELPAQLEAQLQAQSETQGQAQLPGLTLLRAIAIVWVMLYHLESYGLPLPALASHGWMGVDLFFVLSGYLIGGQLLRPCAAGAAPDFQQFFLRRAFRVLPAYLTVLALYAAFPGLNEAEGMQPLWQFLTFTVNLFPDYLHSRAFSHAWSLSVEEQFYVLLPLLVWGLARKPAAWKVSTVVVALLLGGMLLRGMLWYGHMAAQVGTAEAPMAALLWYVESIYNPTYARLDGLLAGVVVALIQVFRPRWWAWAMAYCKCFLLAGVAGLALSLRLNPVSAHGVVFGFPLLSASLALILVALAGPATVKRGWSGWSIPGAAPVAAMAFSLYLTHKLVFHWVRALMGGLLEGNGVLAFIAYMGAALAVGGLLYVLVERPGQRWRERFQVSSRRTGLPQATPGR